MTVNKIVESGVPSECADAAAWAPRERSSLSLPINTCILSYAFFLILLSSPNLKPKYTKKNRPIIIDIGGGSTEIFFSDFQGNEFMKSFKLGAVRLYEKKDKLSEWSKLNNFLDSIPKQNITRLVGVGGNVRSIVKINNNKEFVTLNELQIIHKTLKLLLEHHQKIV